MSFCIFVPACLCACHYLCAGDSECVNTSCYIRGCITLGTFSFVSRCLSLPSVVLEHKRFALTSTQISFFPFQMGLLLLAVPLKANRQQLGRKPRQICLHHAPALQPREASLSHVTSAAKPGGETYSQSICLMGRAKHYLRCVHPMCSVSS